MTTMSLRVLPQLDGSLEAAQARLRAMDADERHDQIGAALGAIRSALGDADEHLITRAAERSIMEAESQVDLLTSLLAERGE